jgi:hypothetical protein
MTRPVQCARVAPRSRGLWNALGYPVRGSC